MYITVERHLVEIGLYAPAYGSSTVGGKGAAMLVLKRAGFPVPDGVIIPTKFFRYFITGRLGEQSIDETNVDTIKDEVYGIDFTEEFREDVLSALEKIGTDSSTFVVRSSANIEDDLRYSFAGLFSSVLNVKKGEIFDAIKKVYASVFNRRVLGYTKRLRIPILGIKMAVIIQEFINTDYAGVAFTADPVLNDSNKMVIEMVKGLGEDLVSGKKTPYSVIIDKGSRNITASRKSKWIDEFKANEIANQLVPAALKIENIYKAPVDIEFGIKNGELFIFQARAITTLK